MALITVQVCQPAVDSEFALQYSLLHVIANALSSRPCVSLGGAQRCTKVHKASSEMPLWRLQANLYFRVLDTGISLVLLWILLEMNVV
jgi:hypothetical protein